MLKPKVEARSGHGEQTSFEKLQEYFNQCQQDQDLAIQKPCPKCQGKLRRQDILSVSCNQCGLTFSCKQILEGA